MNEKATVSWHHVDVPAIAPSNDPKRFERAYQLEDTDQGQQLEIILTRLLSSVFRTEDLYASPFEVTQNTARREFTDLLAICSSGLLIIESKARAVTEHTKAQKTERRVINIAKQIDKALRQLRGAYREALSNGVLVLRNDLQTRSVVLDGLKVHLIVLVSENHADLKDTDTPNKVLDLGNELNAGVHILDLNELSKVIRKCNSPDKIITLLDRRWQASSEHRIIKFADSWLA